MTVEMVIGGFDEMEEALEELAESTRKAAMRRALVKSAKPMADLAASLAPVRSGALAASVAVSTKLDKRAAAKHRRMFNDDRAAVEVFVGPAYNIGSGGRHGHLLEFGTVHSAAQPFMRPAWDQDSKALLERLKVEIWSEIKKSLARAERKALRMASNGGS